MGLIVYPHVFVTGEILTAADLNAALAAISDQVNGEIDAANVSPSANLPGTVLADAPNGVPTDKINDGAVTGAKLANAPDGITTQKINDAQVTGPKLSVGATRRHSTAGLTIPGINITSLDPETDVCVCDPMDISGGSVFFTGALGMFVEASLATSGVILRVYRDATLVFQVDYAVGCNGALADIPIPTPSGFDPLISGPSTGAIYKLTAQVTAPGINLKTLGPSGGGAMHVQEFA